MIQWEDLIIPVKKCLMFSHGKDDMEKENKNQCTLYLWNTSQNHVIDFVSCWLFLLKLKQNVKNALDEPQRLF